MTSNQELQCTLHDYMSLGEVEQGLSMTSNRASEDNNSEDPSSPTGLETQEIQRLPMFLRLLSTTRNLVSLSILDETDSAQNNGKDDDPVLRRTVERLEHVAAIHSVAEGIDVVTCYLAPSMTRRLSRVAPLAKHRNGFFKTRDLEQIARDPKGPPLSSSGGKVSKKARTEDINAVALDESEDDEPDDNLSDGDEQIEDAGGDGTMPSSRKRKRSGRSSTIQRRTSFEVATEDSQEATVVKTLSELTLLVATSLEPIVDHHDDHGVHSQDDHPNKTSERPVDDHVDTPDSHQPIFSLGGTGRKGQLALTIDDSILAETGRDGTGGAMELSDLGSTVAAILHHAPVLRSQHVANALCRASIPQASNLLTRIGANCPASVASLLLGCIEAYQQAIQRQNNSITIVAKQAVVTLAKLSPRETSRVAHKLQAIGIMWDVQFELAIQEPVINPTAAANLLVQQIIRGTSTAVTPSAIEVPSSGQLERQQSAGEEPTDDFRMSGSSDVIHQRTDNMEPTLSHFLTKRPVLYQKALDFLTRQIQSMLQMKRLPRGQLVLFLKAFNSLVLVPGPPVSTKFNRARFLYKTVLPSLQTLTDKVLELLLQIGTEDTLPSTSSMDSLMENLYCAVFLSAACISQDLHGDEKAVEACQELNILLGELPCRSQRFQSFRRNLETSIIKEWIGVVHAQIASVVASHMFSADVVYFAETFSQIKKAFKDVCTLFKPINPLTPFRDGTLGDVQTTIAASMWIMEKEIQPDMNGARDIIKETLHKLLTSDEVAVLPNLDDDVLARFVSKATQLLSNGTENDNLVIPLILSASLERQGLTLHGHETIESIEENGAKFLLQILHAFEFLDAKPTSPFAFDPRSVPLKQAILLSRCLSDCHFLPTRLSELSKLHCMDVVIQLERRQRLAIIPVNDSVYFSMTRQNAVQSLYTTLRSYIINIEKDFEACGCENAFLQGKAVLSDADLCTITCSALMASPHKPRPTITYHSLCRDPLVVLKFPMKIWKSRGLRRITIAVLSLLLESNAVLVERDSPLDSSVDELLAARNVIVVRCILMCICGLDTELGPTECAMMSSHIRSIISAQSGIVASLIKQGLSERAVDWLVEYVPECMNDSVDMVQLLSGRNSLTAAERLVASDTVLRIAIVHGQNSDDDAASMAYAALAQLVDSFFLVVGPVGVPVNALIVDDSGMDVTQISRKAAFRILKALNRVRGRRPGLRKECGMALQKLAALCKSESAVAGVAGTVAGRRKALLKEMYDLIMKTSTIMGSPVGTQAATGQA